MVAGGVCLLFIALTANAASLMILSLTKLQHDFGVREALGAPRRRLIRELLVEGLLLSAGSVVVGLFLSWVLVSVSRTLLEEAALLRSLNVLDIDARALGVALLVGVLVSSGISVCASVIGTKVQAMSSLRTTPGTSTSSGLQGRGKLVLLGLQVGLSIMLLFGATLLVRSFLTLATQERGLDTSGIMVATVEFPSAQFAGVLDRTTAAKAIQEAARMIPGVRMTAWSYGTPPGGGVTDTGLWTSEATQVDLVVDRYLIEPTFFALHDIPVLKGRVFEPSDDSSAVLVSERLASALWPDTSDPIGRRFQVLGYNYHVIGLVRDTRYPSLDRTRDVPQLYVRLPQIGPVSMLTLRCTADCPNSSGIRRQLSMADSHAYVRSVSLLDNVYFRELARPRAMAALALLFAVTALVAVGIGLFSLLTQHVADRRREFAIRAALGASPRNISQVVWRNVMAFLMPGLAVGALGSLWLSQLLSALLFDVGGDTLAWVSVASVFAALVGLSAWHPTRMARRSDPVSLLRDC
jgi:putative ABC transport system permease protein